jgi:nucleoside-diphosphate-sugar epimerase
MTPLIIGAHGYIGARLMADIPGAVAAEGDYRELPLTYLTDFPAVVFLAGHTTVKRCEDDLSGAFANNVTGFAELCARLHPEQRLIFASTGAVYHGLTDATENDDGLPLYTYDRHKRDQERIAAASGLRQWYALRLGTVCGASPKRDDRPLLNRLVADAMDKGRVTIANPGAWRAIAALGDVVAAVRVFLGAIAPESGAYNVASYNATVAQCARGVADQIGAGISLAPDSVTYSFGMNVQKLFDLGWRTERMVGVQGEWCYQATELIDELIAAREAKEAA